MRKNEEYANTQWYLHKRGCGVLSIAPTRRQLGSALTQRSEAVAIISTNGSTAFSESFSPHWLKILWQRHITKWHKDLCHTNMEISRNCGVLLQMEWALFVEHHRALRLSFRFTQACLCHVSSLLALTNRGSLRLGHGWHPLFSITLTS